jgi:hypothetical protein
VTSVVRSRSRGRGQALVEFALVLPIFLLILFGLIDIGRYVYVSNAFAEAARDAARSGAVEQWKYNCPSSVPVGSQDRLTCTKAIAQDRLVGYTFDPAATASWVKCFDPTTAQNPVLADDCSASDFLVVHLSSGTGANRFQFLTPIIGQLIAPPTITGEARVEVQ